MFPLSQIKEGLKSKQVGSYDKTGGNGDCLNSIKDGQKTTIVDVKRAGVISYIWITIALGAEALSRNDIHLRLGNGAASEAYNRIVDHFGKSFIEKQ